MNNKKLNITTVLNKAGHKYHQLKVAKHIAPDQVPMEIQSDQVKALAYVLVEEINKVLEGK